MSPPRGSPGCGLPHRMHRCSPGPQAPRSSRCTPHLTEPHRDPPRWVEALLSHLHFTHEEAEAERLHATQGSPAPKPGLSALDHSGGWYPLLIAPPLFSFIPGRGGGPSWETDIILLIRGRFRLGNIGLTVSQQKKTNPNGSPVVIQAGGETSDRSVPHTQSSGLINCL